MKLVFRLMAILAIAGVAAATYFSLNSNKSAPQTSYLMLDGSQKSTTDWQGHVTLVNFWATSCTTCVAEMPMLSRPTRSTRRRATAPWPWPCSTIRPST